MYCVVAEVYYLEAINQTGNISRLLVVVRGGGQGKGKDIFSKEVFKMSSGGRYIWYVINTSPRLEGGLESRITIFVRSERSEEGLWAYDAGEPSSLRVGSSLNHM